MYLGPWRSCCHTSSKKNGKESFENGSESFSSVQHIHRKIDRISRSSSLKERSLLVLEKNLCKIAALPMSTVIPLKSFTSV